MTSTHNNKTSVVAASAFLLFGGLLVWLILIKSFAAHFAEFSPETALSLNPNERTALLNLAVQKFDQANKKQKDGNPDLDPTPSSLEKQKTSSSSQPDRIESWAKMAFQVKDPNAQNLPTEALQSKDTQEAQQNSGMRLKEDAPSLATKEREKGDLQEAQLLAEKVALQNPLEAKALQLLGAIADQKGNRSEASAYMTFAMQRSLRSKGAVFWLLQESLAKKDFQRSAELFDVLLRSSSYGQSNAMPLFVKFSEEENAKEPIKKLLFSNPPWRPQFIASLPQYMSDARTPLDILLSLKNSPNPPQDQEINSYLNFLISKNFPELAYYAWLQFQSEEDLERTRLIYNGSFETRPKGSPFDWTIQSGSGVTVDIAPNPDNELQKALFIEFNQGRVEFNPVSQTLLLSPGSYHFSGKYKGRITGKRGLVWRVACLPYGNVISETPMMLGIAKNWTEFSLEVEIPETNCTAQAVRLELDARSSSEKLVTGSIWYDDLDLMRNAPQETSAVPTDVPTSPETSFHSPEGTPSAASSSNEATSMPPATVPPANTPASSPSSSRSDTSTAPTLSGASVPKGASLAPADTSPMSSVTTPQKQPTSEAPSPLPTTPAPSTKVTSPLPKSQPMGSAPSSLEKTPASSSSTADTATAPPLSTAPAPAKTTTSQRASAPSSSAPPVKAPSASKQTSSEAPSSVPTSPSAPTKPSSSLPKAPSQKTTVAPSPKPQASTTTAPTSQPTTPSSSSSALGTSSATITKKAPAPTVTTQTPKTTLNKTTAPASPTAPPPTQAFSTSTIPSEETAPSPSKTPTTNDILSEPPNIP